MSKPAKKRPGRPRSVESHQAILQATIDLLIEVGFTHMSIDGIAARAGVGKTTIYRRYSSKEELIADAIESLRQEVVIPDTGSFWDDIDSLIESAAQLTLNPLGKQTVAMIVNSALTNPQFAQMYWTKYLQPRRQGFAIVLKRAKERGELQADADSDLFFDTISSIMLYASVFPPSAESWGAYVRRLLDFLLRDKVIINVIM
ncbi:TetR family transcriptional regulator [Nostoc calcicola FACHB-389]|nr:TetR/AcrR family transcriptional regulator [Nostoc calcicola FACHB-3891]OKH42372.1 TetR family transcriptional regulator [Nostoc calcicola FACHB-389]